MSIYFAFSDENGSYRKWRSAKFASAHPLYIRSNLLINGLEWKKLEQGYRSLKQKYDLPINKEIKWSYVWSLISHRNNGREIKDKCSYYFIKDYDPDLLGKFICESISLLNDLEYCRLIYTVTSNRLCPQIDEGKLLKMHMQEAMQRIEMDMAKDGNNLCVLFIDPVSREKDASMREAYSELYQNGDFIDRYSHIKDSLNFEYSHHSVGIQMADFLAGALFSKLKKYPMGIEIYANTITNILRKGPRGRIDGYGIRTVPRSNDLNEKILSVL